MNKLIIGSIVTAIGLVGCSNNNVNKSESSNGSTANQTEIVSSAPVTANSPTQAEMVQNGIDKVKQQAPDLASAIQLFKNDIAVTNNEMPKALGELAAWHTAVGITWKDINAIPETTYGKVMKDPITEGGKRLCVSGTVIEINADHSVQPPMYHAGIMSDSFKATRVLAVGSTGEIEADKHARFCGIVTGAVSYDNAGGGTTNAPYLIGMFDLPENKK